MEAPHVNAQHTTGPFGRRAVDADHILVEMACVQSAQELTDRDQVVFASIRSQ